MSSPSFRGDLETSLLDTLRRVFAQEFEIDPEAVTPEAHLFDDLELDSVDAVSLAARLEEDTGLALEGADLRAMSTVASVVEIVSARLRERSKERPGAAS